MFSYSIMSNSLPHHGLQHARLPYPSPPPGACSNSHPLNPWCNPTFSPSHLLSSPSPPALNLAQHQGLFQDNGTLNYKYKYIYVYMSLSGWGVVSPSVAGILIKKLELHKTDRLFLTLVFLQDLDGLIFPTDSLSPPAQIVSSPLWIFWICQFTAQLSMSLSGSLLLSTKSLPSIVQSTSISSPTWLFLLLAAPLSTR